MAELAILRRGIRLARCLERGVSHTPFRRPIHVVVYGFLVRNRRLAVAIESLGLTSAYEGRMLLRSMLEIVINYAWIRLKQKHSRALRFLSYQPLELLKIHRSMRASMTPTEFEHARRNLEGQRRRVRHLFRFRDRHGQMQWARSWAKVGSVEARLQEVRAIERPGQPDPFLYALYSWISTAVHAGPNSLREVLRKKPAGVAPARQPERNPRAQFTGAAAALAWTLSAAVEDLKLPPEVRGEVDRYAAALLSLRGRAKRPNTRAA